MHAGLRRWLVLVAGTAGTVGAAGAAHVPSPAMFAGVLVGTAHALASGGGVQLPHRSSLVVQPVLGAAVGATVQTATFTTIGASWPPILLTTTATVAVSMAAGLALARVAALDRPTALAGMIAGGAEAVVAMASDAGRDASLVAVMQYLRVLVVVVTVPLLAALLPAASGHAASAASDGPGTIAGLLLTVGACAGGLALARRLRWSGGTLLAPLAVAAAISVSGVSAGAAVPRPLQQVAFAVVGLQAGLQFTTANLRRATRVLPAVLLAIGCVLAACGGLAALLSALTGASPADAYLATSPGGMSAVLAVALAGGHDTGFIVAVQTLRMIAMLSLARPIVARLAAGC